MTPERIQEHRRHLFGVAYRMLGTVSESEDVLQEAWLRVREVDEAGLRSIRAYLTSVVVRLCLDALGSARARRETYVGPWLPEPLVAPPDEPDPGSLSFAFLLLLETLSPLERAVFLLHEVFDYDHAEIAEALGKSEPAVRKTLSRARAAVVDGKPRFEPRPEEHERLLREFGLTVMTGDLSALEALLAEDVVVHTDGGGKAQAARNRVHGASASARFFLGLVKKGSVAGLTYVEQQVNGQTSVVMRLGDAVDQVLSIETDGVRITQIFVVRNPDKLKSITRTLAAGS